MMKTIFMLAVAASVLSLPPVAGEVVMRELEYAPAPVDNPLKGLVPYAGKGGAFPHSMEFSYLPMSALVTGERKYDWAVLEKLLDEVSSRGHQAVFRVFLEYPRKKHVIPKYLIEGGLKVHRYLNTNTQPLPPAEAETPDYEDPRLREMLRDFIAAMGKRYDGDPRIGFITAGLLGTWGEWHTHPRGELMASKEVQEEVMDAYEVAFRKTPVLLRYPAGAEDSTHAPNAARAFGYHDDSFAWATLDTGREKDDWFFMALLEKAGAETKWRTRVIGGEIRPEAWGLVFDEDPGNPQVQDFRKCVEATHVSWLMDSGMFREKQAAGRVERAEKQVRRMGYEFHIPKAGVERVGGSLEVTVWVENRGVAPIYHDWRPEFALLDAEGRIAGEFPAKGKLTGLLPGDPTRVWKETLETGRLPRGVYQVCLRVANPLPNGKPLCFANKGRDGAGWLVLGEAEIE